MSTNIYILKLEKDNYYVGKTDNIDRRYIEHLNGKGSFWTKKYKPISIEKTIFNASHFDEDKYVKEYMVKYGINKVRGGSYLTEQLSESQLNNLYREIRGALNLCINCGSDKHFVKDCNYNKLIYHNCNQYKFNNHNQSSQESDILNKINNLESKLNKVVSITGPIYTTNDEIINRYYQIIEIIKKLIVISTKIDPKYNKALVNNVSTFNIAPSHGIIYWFPRHDASGVVKLLKQLFAENEEAYKRELVINNIEHDKVPLYLDEYERINQIMNNKKLLNKLPKLEIQVNEHEHKYSLLEKQIKNNYEYIDRYF